jgi:hypothetical protein
LLLDRIHGGKFHDVCPQCIRWLLRMFEIPVDILLTIPPVRNDGWVKKEEKKA